MKNWNEENGNGKRRAKMDIGLLILGVTGAFGIWSSLQTSPTGLWKFVAKDKDSQTERVARDAMVLALGLIGAMSAGLYLVYGRRGVAASIGTMASGIGLYAYYDWLLKQGDAINNGQQSRYSPSGSIGSSPYSNGIQSKVPLMPPATR